MTINFDKEKMAIEPTRRIRYISKMECPKAFSKK